MKKLISLFLASLILAGAAAAQEASQKLDDIIDEMIAARGEEYAAIRDKAPEISPEFRKQLELEAKEDNWKSDNWRRALYASVLIGRVDNPGLFEKVNNPEGIKPEFYKKRAASKPAVFRELTALGRQAIPALLELFEKMMDIHPLGTPPAPEGSDIDSKKEAREARKRERDAFRAGIVGAIARIGDGRAFRFSVELLENRDDNTRIIAAEAAATCGRAGSEGVLKKIASDKGENDEVRCACLKALGFLESRSALDVLGEELIDESAQVRSAAIEGISRMTSQRRWRIAGALLKAEVVSLRAAGSRLLADRVEKDSNSDVRCKAARALGRIADAGVVGRLRRISKDCEDKEVAGAAAEAIELIKRNSAPVSGNR